jgi:hypothetical protein
MAIRDGFIIPNAATYAPDFQTAQPDQGDFVILGNANYGVYNGCLIKLEGSTVSLDSATRPHIIAVNGVVYEIYGSPSTWEGSIDSADTDPRFDLIVFDDSANALTVVRGTPNSNPVLPDITSNMTVLAAVYTPGGSGNRHIIDKRNLLQKVVTGINSPAVLRSYGYSDGTTSVKFNVNGDGKLNWQGFDDASVERLGAGVLKVTSELQATTLTATGSATVGGNDVVTTDTISWGTSLPASGSIGDIFVNNNNVGTSGGSLYIWKVNNGTEEWVPVEPQTPVGSIIMSVLPQSQMPGWLLLDGSEVNEETADGLWGVFPINEGLMVLPDMRGRFPLGAGSLGPLGSGDVNVSRGNITDDDGSITIQLTNENQLPSHRHQNTDAATGPNGIHSHTGTATSAGTHTHPVVGAPNHSHTATDSGHWHYWEGGFPMVAIIPGTEGDSCMDNIFVDSSHTYVTRPEAHSQFGTANITVGSAGAHTHGVEAAGQHNHTVSIDNSSSHTHTVPTHNSVGSSADITFRPPSLSLNFYIKK